MTSKMGFLGGVAILVIGGACSASADFSIGGESVEEAAEQLIAEDLATQLGTDEITPECDSVDDPEVGSTFSCDGTLGDGRVVDIEGVVDSEDHINLQAVNVVDLETVESLLFDELSQQNPAAGLTPDGIDCGAAPGVLVDSQLTCEIAPANADPQTATLTFDDIEAGIFEFTFE